MTRLHPAFAIAASLLTFLSAASCAKSTSTTPEPVSVCTKENEACMFAPGKIGICVAAAEACSRPPCLTCMSQH